MLKKKNNSGNILKAFQPVILRRDLVQSDTLLICI